MPPRIPTVPKPPDPPLVPFVEETVTEPEAEVAPEPEVKEPEPKKEEPKKDEGKTQEPAQEKSPPPPEARVETPKPALKAKTKDSVEKDAEVIKQRLTVARYISGINQREVNIARMNRQIGALVNDNRHYEAALLSEKLQILFVLNKNARKFSDRMEKTLERFEKYSKFSPEKHTQYSSQYLQVAQEAIKAYFLGGEQNRIYHWTVFTPVFKRWLDKNIGGQKNSPFLELGVMRTNTKEAEFSSQNYENLTPEEFTMLAQNIDNIMHVARTRQVIRQGQRLREVSVVAAEVAASIATNNEIVTQTGRDTFKDAIFKRNLYLLKPETILRSLDDLSKEFGSVFRNIVLPIRQAGDVRAAREVQMVGDLNGLFRQHYSQAELNGMSVNSALGGMLPNAYSFNGSYRLPDGTKASREEIIALALNFGTREARDALGEQKHRNPAQWGEEAIQVSIDGLSPNDARFVQSVFDYYDSFWAQIYDLERRRTGVAPEKIDAIGFSVGGVKIKGGYYPLTYLPSATRTLYGGLKRSYDDSTTEQIQSAFTETTFAREATSRGHTMKRVGSGQLNLDLTLAPLVRNLKSLLFDLTMGEPLEDVFRVLKHESVTKALDNVRNGAYIKEAIDVWLRDVAIGDITSHAPFAKLLSDMRSNVTLYAMGWKASTVMSQLGGVVQTIDQIGFKYTMRGFLNTFGQRKFSDLTDRMQFIFDRSVFMRNRRATFTRDVGEILRNISPTPKLFDRIRKTSFALIASFQMVVDSITWTGAYEKYVAENPSVGIPPNEVAKMATTYADSIVRRSQGSGLHEDLAAVERGTTKATAPNSEAIKIWTMFYTYMSAKYSLSVEDWRKMDGRKFGSVMGFMGGMFLRFTGEAVLVALLTNRVPDFDREDEKEDGFSELGWLAYITGDTLFGTLPVLKEVYKTIGTMYDAGSGVSVAINALPNAFDQVAEGEADEKFARSFINVFTLFFGLPGAQINIAVKAMFDYAGDDSRKDPNADPFRTVLDFTLPNRFDNRYKSEYDYGSKI